MNANQIISMVMRMVMRRVMRGGVNAGIDAVGKRMKRGKSADDGGQADAQTATSAKETQKRARQGMRVARKIGRM